MVGMGMIGGLRTVVNDRISGTGPAPYFPFFSLSARKFGRAKAAR